MNKLMYSVWFKHPYTPPKEIEPPFEDYLWNAICTIMQKNTQSL